MVSFSNPQLFLVVGWYGSCYSWQYCSLLYVCAYMCVSVCYVVCVHLYESMCVWYMHVCVCVCVVVVMCLLCLVTQLRPTLGNPMDCSPPGSSVHGESPGKDTGVSCHALLQEVFPTQGSNPGLPHCRQILYHLNHQRSPCNVCM